MVSTLSGFPSSLGGGGYGRTVPAMHAPMANVSLKRRGARLENFRTDHIQFSGRKRDNPFPWLPAVEHKLTPHEVFEGVIGLALASDLIAHIVTEGIGETGSVMTSLEGMHFVAHLAAMYLLLKHVLSYRNKHSKPSKHMKAVALSIVDRLNASGDARPKMNSNQLSHMLKAKRLGMTRDITFRELDGMLTQFFGQPAYIRPLVYKGWVGFLTGTKSEITGDINRFMQDVGVRVSLKDENTVLLQSVSGFDADKKALATKMKAIQALLTSLGLTIQNTVPGFETPLALAGA